MIDESAVEALLREDVRALSAYHLDQEPCRFKLDQNEVPWDLPRSLKTRILARLGEANWAHYPDFHSDALRRALGEHCGHPWEGVLVGNGSNELLGVALSALAGAAPTGKGAGEAEGESREVLSLLPGFGLYRMMVERSGGRIRLLGPRKDLKLPMEELLAEVERDPRRPVILTTPNNPTGQAVAPERVEALLARLEAPLLLDNAYGEFCRHDYLPLLARHPHLLVFRTFSKAWSLAGLRLGYVLAHPRLVRGLIKVKLPYNLGKAAAIAGEEALAAAHRVERRVRAVCARREGWSRTLAERGLEVFPSEANFVLVRVPDGHPAGGSADVRRGLAERGILVRDVSHYPAMEGCLRVTVGSGAALRAVDRALEEMTTNETFLSRNGTPSGTKEIGAGHGG